MEFKDSAGRLEKIEKGRKGISTLIGKMGKQRIRFGEGRSISRPTKPERGVEKEMTFEERVKNRRPVKGENHSRRGQVFLGSEGMGLRGRGKTEPIERVAGMSQKTSNVLGEGEEELH